MKLLTYVIGQGDSIELLANVLLGSYTKAETLVQINKLRYPYISDDPKDQFANYKGSALLTGSYTNPYGITINNQNAINISVNDSILLRAGVNVGSAIVQSVSGSNITFVAPIIGSFDVAATVDIFANQQDIVTQVLRTGDTLLYPLIPNGAVGSDQSFSLLLGSDFAQDENGFIVRKDNDIAIASGTENLGQSLKRRFSTYFGSLNMHGDYGNKQLTILGEAGTPYFAGLAKNYAVECALQDPRINKVEVQNFSMDGDTCLFNLTITPVGSQETIVQPIAVNVGGA